MADTQMTGKRDGATGHLEREPPNRNAQIDLTPPVDIFEDADEITLLADMPGVSRDRLTVRMDGTSLVVEGDVQLAIGEAMQGLHAEVRATHYRRTFALSHELETERIQATLKDGVLTVRIPKRAEMRPRKIEVQAG